MLSDYEKAFQTLKGSLQTFDEDGDIKMSCLFQTLKGSLQTHFQILIEAVQKIGFKPSKDRYKLHKKAFS